MPATAKFFESDTRNWRARLAISVDLMRELSRHTDPDEMYHVYARRMTELYPTARQVSLSRRGLAAPHFRVTRFNLWQDKPNPFKEFDRLPRQAGGLFAELLYGDQPRVIDELDVHPDDPAAEYLDGQRSLLAIPLFEQGVATNMVVVTREEPAAFPREEVPDLVWTSNLFSRAMQTQGLTDQLQDAYDSVDYELRTIAELQQSLLPPRVPAILGLDVAVHYRTANRAGGDYYDFFPLPGGRLGLLVADVSGHGSPAAVLMAITHSLAHSYPGPPVEPGRFLAHLNDHLARRYTVTTGHFVTAFYAVFDPANSSITAATAGHLPPRLGGVEGWVPLVGEQGLPLGVSTRPTTYPERTAGFPLGSRLAVFTDGISEAVNRSGEPFGLDRLDASLGGPTATAAEQVRAVVGQLDRHTADAAPDDDRTLVVVRRV